LILREDHDRCGLTPARHTGDSAGHARDSLRKENLHTFHVLARDIEQRIGEERKRFVVPETRTISLGLAASE
jgi:hypothetical protein